MKSVLVLACLIACSQAAILCLPNSCDNMKCEEGLTVDSCAANGGSLKVKGGFCGCCDLCVQQLGEGDDCTATMLIGAPQTAECAQGLHCNSQTRKCEQPNCAMKAKELNNVLSKLPQRPLGMSIPECDEQGDYAAKQCSGSQCYCVDKSGKSIGYYHNRWETDDKVTCQCARDFQEYKQKGIIGRLFHCSDKGDYQSVQCHGSVCYCADRMTGQQVDGTGVHISQKATLSC